MTEAEMLAEVAKYTDGMESDADVATELAEEGWPDAQRWLRISYRISTDGGGLTDREREAAVAYFACGEDMPPDECRVPWPSTTRRRTVGDPRRYFLDRDNSSHWYLVPVEKRAEWDKWTNLDEDDEASWNTPSFARRLAGNPAMVTFTDPRDIDDEPAAETTERTREREALIASAPTLAARLDEAVGLLRGIMHCSPAFELAPSALANSLLGRINAFLAAIDAESTATHTDP